MKRLVITAAAVAAMAAGAAVAVYAPAARVIRSSRPM